jgi:PhzF family phenazine biosynthesis protein
MTVPLFQVDAFTDRAFAGNPAAVCLLDAPADPAWMQAVAAEMNLSETAFLHREGAGYALRWFTPVAEVALCGHATLAGAHALWESGRAEPGAAIGFATLSGTLTAAREGEWVVMDFPATPPEPAEAPAGLAEALGVAPRWAGRSRFDWLVEAASPEHVAGARPDMARLAAIEGRGVILTAAGGREGADVTSRYFAPAYGIPEDPVTGSAHCALGPLWAARLGRDRLVCHQASARGGTVLVEVRGDRVLLSGRAVTVLEGRLSPAPPRR